MNVQSLLNQIAASESVAFSITDLAGECLLGNTEIAALFRSGAETSQETMGSPNFLTSVSLANNEGCAFAQLIVLNRGNEELSDKRDSRADGYTVEDQFALLNELMANMLSFQTLDPLLQHIADIVIEATDANNALILLVDETNEYLDVVASAGSASNRNMGERRKYGKGFAGLAWSTKTHQYLANCDVLNVTKGYWPPASQLVALPLMSNNTVIGVAVLAAPAHQKNFRASTGLVAHLASLAGIAILNAQSREQAELELSRMRALREINGLLSNFANAAELIQSVSKTLMHAMDISRAVYFMVEDDGVTEHTDVWIKKDGNIVRGESIIKDVLNEGLHGWCYINNQPAYVPRNSEDSPESVRVRQRRKEENIGSMFCVPISANERVVGVMSISRSCAKRDFNENERNLFINICSQISSALLNHELSAALKYRAFHDSLTDLPNRYFLEKELQNELERSKEGDTAAVFFLDLDGFKSVNDTLGHHYGDALLGHVAERFRQCLRAEDIIARIGGDEFAIISSGLIHEAQAQSTANRLIDSLVSPIEVSGVSVNIGVSIGLCFYPKDGHSVETLLRNADQAMYCAKANGKGNVVFFRQSMADESRVRIQLENELRDAIKGNQFVQYFQPQVALCTGEVKSVEALIRWDHPTRGLILPGEFLPVAEDAGLIDSIGEWVLEEAITTLASWRNGPLSGLRIAVNIEASQFMLNDFAQNLLSLLDKHAVPPLLLEIEVTESVVMNEINVVVSTLNTLRAAGVRIAVDDFGTGYSSLSYLQDLPLDVLKIDRSFVQRLEHQSSNQSVANTVMLLAEGLKLETVAEGVETSTQFDQVRQLGCDLVQGYYFAKPCSADNLIEVIRLIGSNFDQKEVG